MEGNPIEDPLSSAAFGHDKDDGKLSPEDFKEPPTRQNVFDNLVIVTVPCPSCHNANRAARRKCTICEGAGTIKKGVDRSELPDSVLLNCDVRGYVDFGSGVVEIRCTQTGKHDKHSCVVTLDEEADPTTN